MPPPTDALDTLTDGTVVIRPWRPADAPEMYRAVAESIECLATWLPWCHSGYALEDAAARIAFCREQWALGEHFAFAVCASDGDLLGSVGLDQRNRAHRNANLGYWIRRTRQRRGHAARAIRLAAGFGFDRLGLIRVEIVAEPHNHGSRRAAERAGARLEGIARQRLWTRGRPADAAVYALVPCDLASSPAPWNPAA